MKTVKYQSAGKVVMDVIPLLLEQALKNVYKNVWNDKKLLNKIHK